MPEGPFGGPRPLCASDTQLVLSFNDNIVAGKRVVREIFKKVGVDNSVDMVDSKTFIVNVENEPLTKRQLDRAERQLVFIESESGEPVGREVDNNKYEGVSIEVRCR